MRMTTAVTLGVLMTVATMAGTPAQDAAARAAEVMALARKAIGGDERIANVKSLSIRGTFQREATGPGGGPGMMVMMRGGPGSLPPGPPGGAQASGDLEIDLVLPDRFVRVETTTGGMAMTRTEGFEGDRPFMDLSSSQPGVRLRVDTGSDDAARENNLRRQREDLARLMLGTLASPPSSFPVTYAYAGVAESPDGTADMIDVAGPDDFKVRLFLDAASHLPLMLTYQAPEPRMIVRTSTMEPSRGEDRGNRGGADTRPTDDDLARAAREAAAEPAKLVEYRMFFSDTRRTDGLMLPYQIARGTGGKTTEQWDLKTVRVNASIKADRFAVGR